MGLEGPQLGQNKREELYKAWCLSQGFPAGPQRGAHSPFHAEGYPPYSWKWGTLTQKEIKLILIGLGEELRVFIITPDEAVPKTFQNCKEIPLVVICKSQFESNFLVLASETTLILAFTQETEHVTTK